MLKRLPGLFTALCLACAIASASGVIDPSKIWKPIPFQLDGLDLVLHYDTLTFVDAVATCAGGSLLPGGRPGSVLMFEAIIPVFSHISIALPDIANDIIEGYGLTSDPNQAGYNLWVWDASRTCRAFWFDLENSMFSSMDVLCDWLLGFVCVDAQAAERRGWQTSLPWYRSYLASSALPSPAVALGPGAWGWSLAEGEAVGSFSPPTSIAVPFNSTPALWQGGPLVSLLYRGGGHNIYALRPVQDSDAAVARSWDLFWDQRNLLAGNHSAYWGVFDLTRDYGAAFDVYNVVAGAHDYVVSVQGCYLPGVQVERLYFVTRTGRSLQFGRGYCTAWFRQDAPPGGYLAAVAGWSLNQTLWPSGPPFDIDVAFIYQIRPIWAVPPGGSSPPPMTVDQPPQLPVTGNTCRSSRLPVTASVRQLGLPGECGAATGAVCNSNQCCGVMTWGRNRLYAVCGTGITPCQTGCMAGYGMCGSLPDRPLLTFVRPASPPLSSYSALLLDAANTPLVVDGSRMVNWTSTVTSPSAAYASAPVSGSNPHQPLPLVYVLKTDGAVTYAEALAFCNSSTHLGLSWELVGLPDSLGFTASGAMRRGAYTAIKDTVMWFQSDPDYVDVAPAYACLRGKFGSQPGEFLDVSIAGPGPCGITAAAMCRAVGLTSANTSVALANQLRQLQAAAASGTSANATSSPVVWKPGRHAVWLSAKRGAGPFSSGSCVFALAGVPQLEVSLLLQVATFTADTAAAAAPAGSSAAQNASSATNSTSVASTAANSSATAGSSSIVAGSINLPISYLDDIDLTGAQPPFAGLSLSRASFSDNSSDASDLISGLRLQVDTSGAATRIIGVESSGGWETMALAPRELVVAVSVCAGGFVERLVMHTSTGRLVTHAWGRHARCTRSFTEAAPPGGYLLGMAGHVGSYVEDLVLAWGTPLPEQPPTAPSGSDDGSSKNTTAVIVGSVVGGTVLLVGLLVAALLLLRRRRSAGTHIPKPPSHMSEESTAGKVGVELGAEGSSSGSGNKEGSASAAVIVTNGELQRKPSAGAGSGGGASTWLGTDKSLSSMRDTTDSASARLQTSTASTHAATTGGSATVRQGAQLGGAPPAGALLADDDLDLDLEGDLAGDTTTAGHDTNQTIMEDGEAQQQLRLEGRGVAAAAALSAATAVGAAAAAAGLATTPQAGSSGSGGLRVAAGSSDGEGALQGKDVATRQWSKTETTLTVSGTACLSTSASTGISGTDTSSMRPAPRNNHQQASGGSARPSAQSGSDTWLVTTQPGVRAGAAGDASGYSQAATTPRKGSTSSTAGVGPSLTAQRMAADSSLTARGNLLPAHAERAMEVVLAPGATGRAGSVTNLGRGSAGIPRPHQLPMLAALAASHGTAGGADAIGSPPAPNSEQREGPIGDSTVGSAASGTGISGVGWLATMTTASTDSHPGPPTLVLGKNVLVDWKGVLGRGCSCVVYRGTLTLPSADGRGGADGATAIPVAVKLLTHLAAAAADEGATGAGPADTATEESSDKAVVEAAGKVQLLNPAALSPELRGQLRMLQAEVAVLSRLDHPNIVKYYGACLDPTATTAGGGAATTSGSGSGAEQARTGSGSGSGKGGGDQASGGSGGKPAGSAAAAQQMPAGMSADMPFLVEELMHVPLSRVIHARKANGSGAYLHDYGLVDILRISRDVANALAYLHPTVVHRDLKPANVLLDERGTAKVGDFGLARFKAGTLLATTNVEVGTTPYMAPENFAAGGEAAVSDKSDVFALGVLINEMVTRQRPWTGTRSAVVGYLVAIEGQRPTMAPADHPHCPPGLRSLIQRCWRQNPDERPSGAEIVKRLTLLLAEHAPAAE